MYENSLKILGLKEDFTIEDLQEAYEKKKASAYYEIYDEAYSNLRLLLEQKTIDKRKKAKLSKFANYVIDNPDTCAGSMLQRFLTITEFTNADDKEGYLDELKSLLRNAPFDFEKNRDETISLWGLYSKYKDASSYNRFLKKKD